jgi:hypothetical protein
MACRITGGEAAQHIANMLPRCHVVVVVVAPEEAGGVV